MNHRGQISITGTLVRIFAIADALDASPRDLFTEPGTP